MNKFAFVASLYVMGGACALLWAGGIYEYAEYRLRGLPARMELAEPGRRLVLAEGGPDYQIVEIRLVGTAGEMRRAQPMGSATARRLAAGEKIPVTYFKDEPRRLFYDNDKPALPWGWLIASLIAFFLARYAHVLLRRENTA